MNADIPYINICFPVYNEEKRIKNGIEKTIEYMKGLVGDDFQISIIDNASDDRTYEIAQNYSKKFSFVHCYHLNEKGVGIALREGIRRNNSPIVGYMDIDLSTDIRHLRDVIRIFKKDNSVDMINGSRQNKKSDTEGRKWYRKLTSKGLTILLKINLGMKATDSICGFKFWRKEVIERLIRDAGQEENGWFYVIELLLRAERENYHIVELPVRWKDDYRTTVNVKKTIINYCKCMIVLRKKFKKDAVVRHS